MGFYPYDDRALATLLAKNHACRCSKSCFFWTELSYQFTRKANFWEAAGEDVCLV